MQYRWSEECAIVRDPISDTGLRVCREDGAIQVLRKLGTTFWAAWRIMEAGPRRTELLRALEWNDAGGSLRGAILILRGRAA